MTNELTESKNFAVGAALDAEFLADAGRGFEEANKDAYAVPFLRVLQDLSPQVKKKMAGYIPGAEPGMLLNTVTQEVMRAVRVIPCYFQQTYIEWVPRDKGGGLAAVHAPGAPILNTAIREGNRTVLPNGNEIMDTRSHFVLLLKEDGTYEQALLSMSSTQLKVSRRWMSQMRSAMVEVRGTMVQAPMYAFSYLISSEEEANDQGSWYSFSVKERQQVQSIELYRAAKAFGSMMASGSSKVNYADLQTAPVSETPADLDNEIEA
ncbi:hypothetical protein UFOVP820_16 [uncultured Caudovirales phage]|uniref:Uncharacterized protein n=1 Tax=uncultured Caudovirales phage TaxID=2100421 RepID=A0A6J5P006_9CAUD|nr:hypothetical protein UFOVP820_16 [uncultured Caudovirales phage]